MDTARFNLAHITNTELLIQLKALVGQSNQITAEILALLAELDHRKLYLELGFPSLFAYAVGALGFSEGSAYKRVYAARAARRFPLILDLVYQGKIHLSAVTMLAAHLTADNHQELLAAAQHQSKRALEELVAVHFPSPDASTILRKLPNRMPRAARMAAQPLTAPMPCSTGAASGNVTAADQRQHSSAEPVRARMSTTAEGALPLVGNTPLSMVTPLSAQHYRLQVTLSQNGRDALGRAQELLGSTVPHGDLATICELALTELVARLEQRKFAKSMPENRVECEHHDGAPSAERPSHPPKPSLESMAHRPRRTNHKPEVEPLTQQPEQNKKQPQNKKDGKSRARYIPAAVRRAVATRDAYQCTFVAADGRRCQERSNLQYHHDEAFAWGGPSSVTNLHLTCRAHNSYHATLDFGAWWIEQAIQMKRERAPARPKAIPDRTPPQGEQSPGIVAAAP